MQDLLDPAAASPHVPTVPAELLRATIDFAPLGIAHFDPDGRVLFANDCLCRILGYTREQLATRTFFELTHADDQAECLALTQRLARGEVASYQQEKRFVRADGSFVWVCVTVSAARDGRGVPLFLIGMRSRNSTPGSAWSYVDRITCSHKSRARTLRYTQSPSLRW